MQITMLTPNDVNTHYFKIVLLLNHIYSVTFTSTVNAAGQ